MSKYDTSGCGCLAVLGIIFFPFMVLAELLKKTK
jgi:hypothetical protein